MRPVPLLLTVTALVIVIIGSVLLGAIDLGAGRVLAEVWAQLTGGISPLSDQEAAILWQLRVPRVLMACLVGAALAGSGAAYQGVFRNPLADPYLLGVASGAGVAATLVIALAPGSAGWALAPAAFVGALGGVALTWMLGRSAGGGRSSTATLLLAGVAIAAFLTAIQNFVLQYDGEAVRQVYSWLLGSMVNSGWDQVRRILPYVLGASVVLCACGRLLDA
ncbi:MAG: FecCD family ABC transporter permease, partial [Sciscionella sp.]